MGFLDMVRAFIVPYASTLFNMDKGKAHTLPTRQQVGKQRPLPAILLLKNGELSFLVALGRDEGPEGVIPITPRDIGTKKERGS